jgi:hypothetical protein
MWSDSQWTFLLGGHEAFEGGRVKEEAWGLEKQDLHAAPWQRTCWHVAPRPWSFGEARDDCRPPTTLVSGFGLCGLFLVPEVEIHSGRSPISDDRIDRRKSAMGPTHYPAKRVPELKKMLEALYRQWRGVLWRGQVLLSCKFINKCFFFFKKIRFLFGQTMYIPT